MIELVITLVIIGVVSAIAIPRLASASENSRVAALKASLKALDTATEFYAAEHEGLLPCHTPEGDVETDGDALAKRLMIRTNADGTSSLQAMFGPYLRAMPLNPYNQLATVRVDGDAPGKGLAGWRFDSGRRRFQADDPEGAAISYLVAGTRPNAGNETLTDDGDLLLGASAAMSANGDDVK